MCLCDCPKKPQLDWKVVTLARGKRPQCRAGLSDDCSMDKWGFVAKEQGEVGG